MHSVIIALLAVAVTLAACANNSKTSLDGKNLFERMERQAGGSAE